MSDQQIQPEEPTRTSGLGVSDEQLHSLNKAQSEVVSVIAHQLRSPLSTIRLAHQTLLENEQMNLTVEQIHLLQQAEKRATRIYDLINQLLELETRSGVGAPVALRLGSIESLLQDLLAQVSIEIKNKSLELHKLFADNRRPVPFDARVLSDAIVNIIDNAISYTPENGTITIATSYSESEALIKISDTGVGVPKDKVSSLFRKYNRFDNTGDSHADGLGLGLYIAKRAVESHRGTISYEDTKPHGATFCIRLPAPM